MKTLKMYLSTDGDHTSPDQLGADSVLSDGHGTGGRIVARGDQPELVAAITLAAAAPDLLAACKSALQTEIDSKTACDELGEDYDHVKILRAAIAKAEGK